MRIVSNFADYYDRIINDHEGKVWKRFNYFFTLPNMDRNGVLSHIIKTFAPIDDNKEAIPSPLSNDQVKLICKMFDDRPRIRDLSNRSYDKSYILGFCGKLYYIINVINESSYIRPEIVEVFDNVADYKAKYDSENKQRFYYYQGLSFNEWQRKYNSNKEVYNLFISLQTPIFLMGYNYFNQISSHNDVYFVTNPALKSIKFQSIFDPYAAYQEIDMFINNDLVSMEDHDIKRTDELIRDSKGFDNWSFKQKGPKPRKNKKIS